MFTKNVPNSNSVALGYNSLAVSHYPLALPKLKPKDSGFRFTEVKSDLGDFTRKKTHTL